MHAFVRGFADRMRILDSFLTALADANGLEEFRFARTVLSLSRMAVMLARVTACLR